jgi:hypothetical protein
MGRGGERHEPNKRLNWLKVNCKLFKSRRADVFGLKKNRAKQTLKSINILTLSKAIYPELGR